LDLKFELCSGQILRLPQTLANNKPPSLGLLIDFGSPNADSYSPKCWCRGTGKLERGSCQS